MSFNYRSAAFELPLGFLGLLAALASLGLPASLGFSGPPGLTRASPPKQQGAPAPVSLATDRCCHGAPTHGPPAGWFVTFRQRQRNSPHPPCASRNDGAPTHGLPARWFVTLRQRHRNSPHPPRASRNDGAPTHGPPAGWFVTFRQRHRNSPHPHALQGMKEICEFAAVPCGPVSSNGFARIAAPRFYF